MIMNMRKNKNRQSVCLKWVTEFTKQDANVQLNMKSNKRSRKHVSTISRHITVLKKEPLGMLHFVWKFQMKYLIEWWNSLILLMDIRHQYRAMNLACCIGGQKTRESQTHKEDNTQMVVTAGLKGPHLTCKERHCAGKVTHMRKFITKHSIDYLVLKFNLWKKNTQHYTSWILITSPRV